MAVKSETLQEESAEAASQLTKRGEPRAEPRPRGRAGCATEQRAA